jgi:DNA-binding Lrp family transcriptional regulator
VYITRRRETMITLEEKVSNYIKENSKETGNVTLPLSQIAEDIDSSTATVWRAIQKLEDKRVIKVVKPSIKSQPNEIYYLGEEDGLNEIIDDLLKKTAMNIIILKELKKRVKERDDLIFSLKKELEEYKALKVRA